MKKSLLIFSILGVLTFTSCSTGTTENPPVTVDDDDKTEDETPVTPVEDNYLPEDVLAKLQAEEIGFHAPSVARDMYLVYSSATGEWRDEPHLVYYDDFYVSYKDGLYIKNFVEFFDEKTTHTEEDVEEGLGDRYVWYVQKGEDNHPYMTEGEVDITNEIVFDEVLCRLGTNQHLYFDDLFANPFADVSRYNFEKDSEGRYVCTSQAIANAIVNSFYYYETMSFSASSVYITIGANDEITIHAETERSRTEDNMVSYAYNYKYTGDFVVTTAEDYDVESFKYEETAENKLLGDKFSELSAAEYLKVDITSSQAGWDGMEYVLVKKEGEMPYLYPVGLEFGYYENASDDNIIYRFNVTDGVAVAGDQYIYPRPEGSYYFVDIEAISASFDLIAHEIFNYDKENGYYTVADSSLTAEVAKELAPNPEFKFDFESVTTNRITLMEDGSMQVYNRFTDMSSGTPTRFEYTITYSIGDGSEITFNTDMFKLA